MVALYLILVTVVSYLIGAIPIGAIVAATQKIDIAQHGSGKTGTTNVLRTVGKRAAAVVLIGDALKGMLAVLLARWLEPYFVTGDGRLEILGFQTSVLTVATLLAACAVVVGHVWSIYLRIVYGKWHGRAWSGDGHGGHVHCHSLGYFAGNSCWWNSYCDFALRIARLNRGHF